MVDVLTKEVHYKKSIKSFRMFSACGKGDRDRIYLIGGLDPVTKKWTSNATVFESLTLTLKNHKKGDL